MTLNQKIVELIISDNGIGLPEISDIQNCDSLGLKLVKVIAENHLDGSFVFNNHSETRITINFNIDPI